MRLRVEAQSACALECVATSGASRERARHPRSPPRSGARRRPGSRAGCTRGRVSAGLRQAGAGVGRCREAERHALARRRSAATRRARPSAGRGRTRLEIGEVGRERVGALEVHDRRDPARLKSSRDGRSSRRSPPARRPARRRRGAPPHAGSAPRAAARTASDGGSIGRPPGRRARRNRRRSPPRPRARDRCAAALATPDARARSLWPSTITARIVWLDLTRSPGGEIPFRVLVAEDDDRLAELIDAILVRTAGSSSRRGPERRRGGRARRRGASRSRPDGHRDADLRRDRGDTADPRARRRQHVVIYTGSDEFADVSRPRPPAPSAT